MADSGKSRMDVTLKVGGVFFALANIICVAILCWTYLSVKLEPKTIEVKGSAKKSIESDLITWTGVITAHDEDLIKAYDKIKANSDKVAAFIKAAGVNEGEVTFSAIATAKVYKKEWVKQPHEGGGDGEEGKEKSVLIQTNKVEQYNLTQWVTIESKDMKRVPEVARNVTSLIKDGVEIDSGDTRYLYTKLSELKINMLAEATKDATTRATQIVTNANGKLGKLVEARMGVMQINPKGKSDTSAEGINDTSSFEKEITAIVTARFQLD